MKTSAVINVGTATLAALIGAGGLGEPIISGLYLSDSTLILEGGATSGLPGPPGSNNFRFPEKDRSLIPKACVWQAYNRLHGQHPTVLVHGRGGFGHKGARRRRPKEAQMIARLLSVNVGLPREINWRGQTVRTAIWRNPVQGKRMVRRLTLKATARGIWRAMGASTEQKYLFTRSIPIAIRQDQHSSHRLHLWTVRRELHN